MAAWCCPDVDIAVARNDERPVDRVHALQHAEWLDVTVHRVESEKVTALSAGGAVQGSIRRNRQCPDRRFVRRNHIHGRVAEIAQVDANLFDN